MISDACFVILRYKLCKMQMHQLKLFLFFNVKYLHLYTKSLFSQMIFYSKIWKCME